MSETLPLAERLKKRRQEDTEIIQNHLHETLNDSHEQWTKAMNEKLNTIDNDITDRHRKLMKRIVWIPITLSVVLCGTLTIVIYKSLGLVLNDIMTAKMTLSALEAHGGKTSISDCAGKVCIEIPHKSKARYFSTKDGRYFVIPKEK